MKNKLPNWDLKVFYKNINDPKIEKDKKETLSLVEKFNKTYRNKINSPKITSKFLLKALIDYQNLLEKLYIFGNYASLVFSTNTIDPKIKSLYQSSHEFMTQINSQILWFQLELIAIDEKNFKKLTADKNLDNFRHFLEVTRILKPFTLSENEEKIMSQKSQTSSAAFVRLYDETDSTEKFELEIKGKKQSLTDSEVGSIMKSNPDRNLRENATKSYANTFANHKNLYSFILNTLLLDKKVNDEIRNFKFPQQATLLDYEINLETVNNMSKVILENRKLVENFYLQKSKITKIKKLYEWDRYSDIYNLKEKTYSWEESKEIILNTFKEFSEVFYKTASVFFDNNWIDAEVKSGKRSGAFCSFTVPSLHPVVFVNFTGKIEDITTLAHELGHAIHAYLSRENGLLEYQASTATAEIASTFCENLVFEKLFILETDKKQKINLLARKIQNEFATVFRQNDFYIYETKIHEIRREKGELTPERFGDLYQETLQQTFGKGLTLTNMHQNMWMPILHFYHYNFYVFTYCFGDLLALSLLGLYKKDKGKFVKNYTKALTLGGSKNPYEITKIMGVNISDKNFWQNGLNLIKEEVEEFLKLSN